MTTAYGLATIRLNGQSVPALKLSDAYWPVAASGGGSLPRAVATMLDDWDKSRAALGAIADAIGAGKVDRKLAIPAASAQVEAPIQFPRKVIGVGANYAKHVAKAVKILEKRGMPHQGENIGRPTFFFKPASTAIVGPGKTARYPIDCKEFDWEIELSIVIGLRARNVPAADALRYIAGYTVGLDMSARDLHFVPRSLFKFDAFAGKAHDAGAPIGPTIVPSEFVGDPQKLRVMLSVNGEKKQDGNTADMVYDCAKIVHFASRIVTLEPGDVIMTGTPEGTGIESETFLKVGDKISATIDKLGTLDVEVIPT